MASAAATNSSTSQAGRQQYDALIVFMKTANAEAGLLWIPRLAVPRKYCPRGLRPYKLGQWIVFCENGGDGGDNVMLPQTQPAPLPYETQLFESNGPERNVFVQVKVPIVYFSAAANRQQQQQMVVHSPGFGRVGYFEANQLTPDTLYYAWIAFMAHLPVGDWQQLLMELNVQWVVVTVRQQPLSQQEMLNAHTLYQFELVKGIVVNVCHEGNNDENSVPLQRAEEQQQQQQQQTTTTITKFWHPAHKQCIFRRVNKSKTDQRTAAEFAIGDWCCFMLAENWSNESCAVSPFPIETPHGISIINTAPLTAKISDEFIAFDPMEDCVRVPDWFGTFPAVAAVILQEIRQFFQHKQQRGTRPERQPHAYLYVVFNVPENVWNAIYFDDECRDQGTSSSQAAQQHKQQEEQEQQHQTLQRLPIGVDLRITKHYGSRGKDNTNTRTPRNFARKLEPIVNTNLHGVVVALAKNDAGFFIYSPQYPEQDIFLPRSRTKGDIKHGSWLCFDVRENGNKLFVSRYELDNRTPFDTTPTGNTVQLKLNAFVPRIWRPGRSDFVSILKTEFVSQAVDVAQLIGREYAGQQVRVLIERIRNSASGFAWHVRKVFD